MKESNFIPEDSKSQYSLPNTEQDPNNTETPMQNREQVIANLRQSFTDFQSASLLKTTVNKVSYFLEALWQELMPPQVKGNQFVAIESCHK
jgi:hypothetical protein